MTLIISVQGRQTLWMLADQRLSRRGRPPVDNARKLLCLKTSDATAVLGYTGLGATRAGTEPADWMSALLRGRDLTLEQALTLLKQGMERELPRHFRYFPSGIQPSHSVLASAFVGTEVRHYSIRMQATPDRLSHRIEACRVGSTPSGGSRAVSPRMGIAGSGSDYFRKKGVKLRELLRLVNASDNQRVPPAMVADYLARLNQTAHEHTPDRSVGPTSLVVVAHRADGPYRGGGQTLAYNMSKRLSEAPTIPTIWRGRDMVAMGRAIMDHFLPQVDNADPDHWPQSIDVSNLDTVLASLPDKPDEALR